MTARENKREPYICWLIPPRAAIARSGPGFKNSFPVSHISEMGPIIWVIVCDLSRCITTQLDF